MLVNNSLYSKSTVCVLHRPLLRPSRQGRWNGRACSAQKGHKRGKLFFFFAKPEETRQLVRHGHRWEDNIKVNLKYTVFRGVDWVHWLRKGVLNREISDPHGGVWRWNVAQCSLVEFYWRFRGAWCLFIRSIALWSVSETSVNFYHNVQRNNLEDLKNNSVIGRRTEWRQHEKEWVDKVLTVRSMKCEPVLVERG
jgi:hypothetical protein